MLVEPSLILKQETPQLKRKCWQAPSHSKSGTSSHMIVQSPCFLIINHLRVSLKRQSILRMPLGTLCYDTEVKYLTEKHMYTADTLSRAHLLENVGQVEFETVNAVTYLTMPEENKNINIERKIDTTAFD